MSSVLTSRRWRNDTRHRLLVFAKRDVSVVLKRHKVARVGGLVVNRDLGTGVMGNKGGLVSTFVVEKEGFATTCTAINAHLYAAGVPRSRTRVRAARIEERRRGGGPTRHREKLRADGVEVDVQSPP